MVKQPYVVVFDIETQDKITSMPGNCRYDQVSALQVSCLSYLTIPSARLFDSEDARRAVDEAEVTTLWRDVDVDGHGPFAKLFEAFDGAEVIAAYNGYDFDFPVLHKHATRLRNESFLKRGHDPFARLRATTQVWYKLDNLLKANHLETKTANGLEAIKMWEDGRREELASYCAADVKALSRLLVLPELSLPGTQSTMPNSVFGLASAVSAARTSALMVRKRRLDTETGDGGVVPNAAPGIVI